MPERMRGYAKRHGIVLDSAQERALREFERLSGDLLELERSDSWLGRLLARRRAVQGLYLWGGVGRGKSFLVDAFYECVPIQGKRRLHFHRFMQDIHHRLRELQGQEDPLVLVARDIARQVRLLCLDEFQVTDITDAMLMRRLLEGLFDSGVALVTTSNLQPDELYMHGLQREQFLPAIGLLKQRLRVVNVDAGIDYRLRMLEQAGVYHHPLDPETDAKMAKEFESIASDPGELDMPLEIEQRIINARRVGNGVAWFEFGELCDGPRGQADYIELARRYHTVLLSNVPRLRPSKLDVARRFTWLVDEFYDRKVKLVISAEAPAHELFDVADSGDAFLRNLNTSFVDRTVSRLIEMQTHDYLALPHLP
ncbi:MAG: AFG1 family ATPase [Betaproteobacteria bacterium]|nr:MAG: AFG1 family ATPase [Betaproteobacteria bacterium]